MLRKEFKYLKKQFSVTQECHEKLNIEKLKSEGNAMKGITGEEYLKFIA